MGDISSGGESTIAKLLKDLIKEVSKINVWNSDKEHTDEDILEAIKELGNR